MEAQMTDNGWRVDCRGSDLNRRVGRLSLNNPYPQFQGHAILWCWISQKRYDIQTQCHWNTNTDLQPPTQQCHFKWPWVTLSDLVKYSMTRSVARSLCDSWASCLNKCCELRQRFLHAWHGIDQNVIDNAIDEWHGRLRACMRAKGGHFEQLLWQYSAICQETFLFLSNVTRFWDCFFRKLPIRCCWSCAVLFVHCVQKKHPLLFSSITLRKSNQFEWKFQTMKCWF